MGIGFPVRREERSTAVAAGIVTVFAAGVVAVALRGGATADFEAASGTALLTTSTTVDPSATADQSSSDVVAGWAAFGPVAPPSSRLSTVARAAAPQVAVYATSGDGEPQQVLVHPQPSGAPLVFLVRQLQPEWLEVLLPGDPSGSGGWIRQAEVTLTQHDFAVVVERQAHRMTVFKAGQPGLQEPVGLGACREFLEGLYYVKELLQPPAPDTLYGAYAYGLSGFSSVLVPAQGGEGVIGLHGTNDPSGIGRDVSAGCIRMSDEAITRLAGVLPLGTPVEIRP